MKINLRVENEIIKWEIKMIWYDSENFIHFHSVFGSVDLISTDKWDSGFLSGTVDEKVVTNIKAKAKAAGKRVISVGTTSTRTLESAADENGMLRACSGWTEIFIYPGYQFKAMDGLITNFHLPESTLIMLVSAFMGYENTMNAYKIAVEERYRFFSFGDSMCILP